MEVLAAFRTTKGNAVHAADELGVSHRALTRWMRTHKDLARRLKEKHPNRNSVQRLKFRGKTRTIADWADELGVSRQTIYHRLDAGWPVARALSEEA